MLAALLSQGCATNPSLRVPATAATTGALLDAVPFHPQTAFQCGPAALATVLGASGAPAAPEALAPQVYLPERQGSLQVELLAAARRAGRIAYVVDPVPEALWAELGAGRPVLVLQNLWVRSLPKWHYAVLVGADATRNQMVLNSGDRRGLRLRAPVFMRTWDWAGRWGMVTLAPGELPANADPARYLLAVADFEKVAGADAAAPAYRAALRSWPNDPRAHLALGNHAYATQDRPQAARHYRDGLRLAPADPVLGNNLASVLGELNCKPEAIAVLAVVQAQLPADSPWRSRIADTTREVEAARGRRDPACDALR